MSVKYKNVILDTIHARKIYKEVQEMNRKIVDEYIQRKIENTKTVIIKKFNLFVNSFFFYLLLLLQYISVAEVDHEQGTRQQHTKKNYDYGCYGARHLQNVCNLAIKS